jgi:hypothetical protein
MIIQFMMIGVIYVFAAGIISLGGYAITSGVEW